MAPLQSIKFQTANFPIFCARITVIFWATCTGRQDFSVVIMGNVTHILPVLHWLEVVIAFVSSFSFYLVFTCVSYAEARNRYRLDVRPFVRPSVRSSVRPSVRPSVHLSVTRWYCIKTAEYIDMLSPPYDTPFILVLCVSSFAKFRRAPAGPLNRGGVWKYRNFRTITCYSSETVDDRWVHAARLLTSIELSFGPCNTYREGRTQGKPKCAKMC